jgi:plasmid replication initiation protein
MKQFLLRILERLAKSLKEEQVDIIKQPQEEIIYPAQPERTVEFLPPIKAAKIEEQPNDKTIQKEKLKRELSTEIIEFNPRDMMEVMEVPFLALSKNRIKPIIYQSKDGRIKVKVSAHREHYVASIYDWDIILLLSSKLQEIINSSSDIPPKTIIISRNQLLKAIHKHSGKANRKEIEQSLARLKFTGIETTIRNEDYRYKGGFGFLDSWGYTERKDIKEFEITLSQWLYDGICKKGSLLKVSPRYFDLTSGLKKFLYRTARKHVGNNDQWEFSIEKLYEKSGSEQIFRFFKRDLKKVVLDNDIPDYFLEWIIDGNKILIRLSNKRKKLIKMLTQ